LFLKFQNTLPLADNAGITVTHAVFRPTYSDIQVCCLEEIDRITSFGTPC